MKSNFEQLGIQAVWISGLTKASITEPTPVQAAVIPEAIEGKDIVAQSPTGTGKTIAYLLPLLQKMVVTKRETQALVLAPTHELAMQIFRQAEILVRDAEQPVAVAAIIGDVNITRQIDRLKEKPHLIVGSAGRILEMIQKKKINAQTVKTIVIDEADRMLDEGNNANVAAIIRATQKDRQLLLFSATITKRAAEQAEKWMRNPVYVSIRPETAIPDEISHVFLISDARAKIDTLRRALASLRSVRTLVFVNTAAAIAETVAKLSYHGVAAAGIHGSSSKMERQAALDAFRAGGVRVLVASDLAARGLDIVGVENVINLDLPEDPQAYLHRAGRTGRAGETGQVISIVDQRESKQMRYLQKVLQIRILEKKLSFGKIIDS